MATATGIKGNKDEEKHLIDPSLHANGMSIKCIRAEQSLLSSSPYLLQTCRKMQNKQAASVFCSFHGVGVMPNTARTQIE